MFGRLQISKWFIHKSPCRKQCSGRFNSIKFVICSKTIIKSLHSLTLWFHKTQLKYHQHIYMTLKFVSWLLSKLASRTATWVQRQPPPSEHRSWSRGLRRAGRLHFLPRSTRPEEITLFVTVKSSEKASYFCCFIYQGHVHNVTLKDNHGLSQHA